jgi:branched-chain amino acid aminotransferase
MADQAHPRYLWLDGELVPWEEATVHITDLGWVGVGSVFEGIKAYRNDSLDRAYVFRLEDHLRRFADSMRLVELEPRYSPERLAGAVVELLRASEVREDTYIRPFAFASRGRYLSRGSSEAVTRVLINTFPFESRLNTDHAVHCCVSSWTRISDNVMPPRIKAVANYWNGRLAGNEATRNGYDGAILLNDRRKVAEGPGACLMLVRRGQVITPPVTAGILDSITRATLIRLARQELGIEVVEREVDRTELYLAEEAFFCGTGAEVRPILSVDRFILGDGQIGPHTRQIGALYHDVVRGIHSRYEEWRTLV